LTDPAVSAVAWDRRLLGIASEALGGDAFPFKGTLFDKSRRANWLVAWHQDTLLPLRVRREVPGWGPWSIKAGVLHARAPAEALEGVVALRVHLDDSTSDNGPLKVLPGTHRLGVLTNTQIQRFSHTIPPVECTVPRGGILTMRPLLVHSSSKASGPAPRRVLHIEYATSRDLGNGLELGIPEHGS
jgi:ectoine hydroxylase-related dioxygenase (phytanoyl-CoA dioxygenase family)